MQQPFNIQSTKFVFLSTFPGSSWCLLWSALKEENVTWTLKKEKSLCTILTLQTGFTFLQCITNYKTTVLNNHQPYSHTLCCIQPVTCCEVFVLLCKFSVFCSASAAGTILPPNPDISENAFNALISSSKLHKAISFILARQMDALSSQLTVMNLQLVPGQVFQMMLCRWCYCDDTVSSG